jgi:hypothetical protein
MRGRVSECANERAARGLLRRQMRAASECCRLRARPGLLPGRSDDPRAPAKASEARPNTPPTHTHRPVARHSPGSLGAERHAGHCAPE